VVIVWYGRLIRRTFIRSLRSGMQAGLGRRAVWRERPGQEAGQGERQGVDRPEVAEHRAEVDPGDVEGGLQASP